MHLTDWDGKNLNGHGEKEETYFFAINKKAKRQKNCNREKEFYFYIRETFLDRSDVIHYCLMYILMLFVFIF
jgi:hypothetical protein